MYYFSDLTVFIMYNKLISPQMKTSKNRENKEKLKEIIWFISRNYNSRLFETKLWKLLFFSEADYYQKYGRPISGVPYIKNTHGPTPSHPASKKVLEGLSRNGYLAKNSDGTFVATKDLEIKHLTSQEMDSIRSTCEKYFQLSTTDICLLAHKDPVYLAAEKNGLVDFSFVRYREDEEVDMKDETFEKIDFGEEVNRKLLSLIS